MAGLVFLVVIGCLNTGRAAPAKTPSGARERKIPLSDAMSSWGYYGVTPESPDGKRLCYTIFPNPDGLANKTLYSAELWVANIDGTGHKRLFKGKSVFHNGLNQSWVDNNHIVFASNGDTYIINADTGKIAFGPFEGFLPGHYALGGKVLMYQKDVFTKPRGIYEFDTATGKLRLAIPYDSKILHVQCSADGKTILFRTKKDTFDALAKANLENGEVHIFPNEKPMHFQWFDERTFFGSIVPRVTGGDPQKYPLHQMYRWNLAGEIIEHLAGEICHGAARADGQYLAGESWYGSNPIVMRLYRRDQIEPIAEIFSHNFTPVVWGGRNHVNPSFSRDGMRLYYNRGVSKTTSQAFCCDLTGWVEPMTRKFSSPPAAAK